MTQATAMKKQTNSETEVPDISPTTPVTPSHSMETVPGPAPTTSTPLHTSPVPPTEMNVFVTEQCIASTTQQSFLSDQPPFMKKAGSLLPLDETDHPCEFFEAIFGSNTFDHIATQTNLYASQCNVTWEETSSEEIKAFFGLLLAMGVHRLPFLTDYWSQNPLLGAPGITKCMPRDRFKAILIVRCQHAAILLSISCTRSGH